MNLNVGVETIARDTFGVYSVCVHPLCVRTGPGSPFCDDDEREPKSMDYEPKKNSRDNQGHA